MKLVYICSPYLGDIQENAQKARKYCRYAADKGVIPIAPRLLFPQFLSELTGYETVMLMSMELLSRCDEVWLFSKPDSIYAEQEIKKAEELKIEVLFVMYDNGEESFTIKRLYDTGEKEKNDKRNGAENTNDFFNRH